MNIDRDGVLQKSGTFKFSFWGYTQNTDNSVKLESDHTTLRRSPTNACRNQYIGPTAVKSVSSLTDPDSNPDTVRLGVQRVLSAYAATSVPFLPKGKTLYSVHTHNNNRMIQNTFKHLKWLSHKCQQNAVSANLL